MSCFTSVASSSLVFLPLQLTRFNSSTIKTNLVNPLSLRGSRKTALILTECSLPLIGFAPFSSDRSAGHRSCCFVEASVLVGHSRGSLPAAYLHLNSNSFADSFLEGVKVASPFDRPGFTGVLSNYC